MNYIGWNGAELHATTEDHTVNTAMVGFKKEDTKFSQLIEIREQRLERYYTDHALYKITDVIEGRAKDITVHYTSKRVNVAPDWKRKFYLDDTSVPFESLEEWEIY